MLRTLVPWLLIAVGLQCPSRADCSPPPARAPQTAEAWLDRITAHMATVKSVHADVSYVRIDGVGVLDDKQTRRGTFVFGAGPPARFAIHFSQLFVDGRPQKHDTSYIFDGRWLVERNELEKLFTKRLVVPPDAPPQLDPLANGQGPFYLPITSKKQEILQRFDATLVESGAHDAPNTVHLRLVPKKNQRLEVRQVDLWYDKKTLMLVRAETRDDVPNLQIVVVKNPQLNRPIDPKRLDVTAPPGDDWRISIEKGETEDLAASKPP